MADSNTTEHSTISLQNSKENANSLLLVALTRLSKNDEKNLIAHLQPSQSDFHVETWSPDDQLLRSIAPQGQYRDSQATLYGLAIWLHRTGRSHFIVADDLTKRQLEGKAVRGEPKEISVVKLGVRPGEGDQIRVIARRSAPASDENIDLLEAVKTFEINQGFINERTGVNLPIFFESGLQLHDPDNGFFIPDTAGLLGHEAIARRIENELATSTPFPAELVLEIASRGNDRDDGSVEIPKNLDLKRNINVFLAFRTSDRERKELQAALQKAVHVEWEDEKEERVKLAQQKNEDGDGDDDDADSSSVDLTREPEVHLIPWNKDHPMSRRDAMRIHTVLTSYKNYRGQPITQSQSMDILLEPLKVGNVNEANFASIFYPPLALAVARSSLKKLVHEVGDTDKSDKYDEFASEIRNGFLIDSNKFEIIPSQEILSSYDEPFHPNPPPWQPVDRTVNHISLFYMTNKLSKDQDRAIWDEIRTPTDIEADDVEDGEEKAICPVPWEPGEETGDAPLEYMLKAYESVPDTSFCGPPYFFVDKQSGIDRTVAVVEADLYYGDENDEKAKELLKDTPDPRLRGIRYARITGREAHGVYANLSIANMDLEEFELRSEIMKVPRPGWPGHGILFNEEELEEMEHGEGYGEEGEGGDEDDELLG